MVNKKKQKENIDVNSFDFTNISRNKGDIMHISTKNVVTNPQTTSIMSVIKTMARKKFRRIPITNAGTNKIEGIITSMDVVDFLGGGQKNSLVEKKHKGNLLAAINDCVCEIMQRDVVYLQEDATIVDAASIMCKKRVGGIPIIDSNGRVCAICTEKDFVGLVAGITIDKTVKDYMSVNVKTTSPDTTIGEAAKIMVQNKFRRLPIVKDGILLGVVTATNILNFVGDGVAFDKLVTGNIHEAFDEPIHSLISKESIWVPPDMDIGEAASLMIENKVGSLIVLNDGALEGIITERDFLQVMTV